MQLVQGKYIAFLSGILAFYLLTIGGVAASTLVVNSSFDPGTNFTSIQTAIDAANPGDEIIVQPGLYTENIEITKNVTLISESQNPSDTVIQAANTSEDVFSMMANNITLKGFTIKGSSTAGIHFFGTAYCRIENNRLTNNGCGADLYSFSSDNTLNNNEILDSVTGVSLADSWYNSLANNKVSNCSSGVSIFDSQNNTLKNNLIFENEEGISLIGESNGNILTNNTIIFNKKLGLNIYETSDNLIYNNYFNNTLNVQSESGQVSGTNLWSISRTEGPNIVGGPYMAGNFWDNLNGSAYPEDFVDSDLDGIYDTEYQIEGSDLIDSLPLKKMKPSLLIVSNNPDNAGGNTSESMRFTSIQGAINNAFPGDVILVQPGTYTENIDIYVPNVILEAESPANTFIQAASSKDDILYIVADGVKVSGFSISGLVNFPNSEIHLNGAKYCRIENNQLSADNSSSDPGFGIRLDFSTNNSIIGNTLSDNGNSIFMLKSDENTLLNNILHNSIYGIRLENSLNNTFDGNNISDNKIGVYLKTSTGNLLNNSVIQNSKGSGINLLASDENKLYNSIISANNVSITLRNSSNNSIGNNIISLNSYGLKLYSSGDNSITDNEIIENELGAYLKNSSENILSGNSINTNTVCGVSLNSSTDNILHNNEIRNNSECGLFLLDSKSNLIYNNYFNNTINIYLQGINPENNLNINKTRAMNIVNGPYIGGNFWGTPAGDGFSQIQLDKDGDGICDAAYSVDEEINDYLPLAASDTTH